VGVALYTRFGFHDRLWRDEAIYAYAGQQMAEGVPPYASIFDPKTPLASMIDAAAVAAGRLVGVDDLLAMRALYLVFSLLTVVAVYYLTQRLWRSPLAGVVAATVFASFRGFAIDAMGGPGAKTPGILFAVVSMALMTHRRWFWAAFVGSLAFLVWQPLAIYAAVAVVLAPVLAPLGERRRSFGLAVAGAAIPVVLTTIYFVVAGAMGKLVVAAFVFPATGIKRGSDSLANRLVRIGTVILRDYQLSGLLFMVGFVLLFAVVALHLARGRHNLRDSLRDPVMCVVVSTALAVLAFSSTDFQGYPDLYPLLPYAAIGFGGTVAVLQSALARPALRQAVTAGALVCVLALTAVSWVLFSRDKAHSHRLTGQRIAACNLERMLGPGPNALWSLGDPTPLVLTHRRNPSRFIYLSSGVAAWDMDHTPGGQRGWRARLLATHPDVVVVNGWRHHLEKVTTRWLRSRYDPAYIGAWQVFLAPGVRERAVSRGIVLQTSPGRAVAADGCRPGQPAYGTLGRTTLVAANDQEGHHAAR
jgi:hypothetical protein